MKKMSSTPRPSPLPQRRLGRRGPRADDQAASGRPFSVAPGLTRDGIVDAALRLVAEDGIGGLSTRKLGQRLHCEAMSIYHHYPSKQHLLDALVDRAIGSLEWPPAELPPMQRLRAAMNAYRAMAHRYPALFPYLAVHRLNTPTGVRFIEGILTLVQAVVPDPEKAARHFRTLGYFLVGAALDETAGYAKGPSAAEPVDSAFIARECPSLMGAARWFQREQWDATFELGVQAMLQSLERDSGVSGAPSPCRLSKKPRLRNPADKRHAAG